MNVDNICRNRSGEASASCSCNNRAGSILGLAVIASISFERTVEGLKKDHAMTASINVGLAQAKIRSGLGWWLLSLLLGPAATLLIVILPSPRP
jgi:hypothetical protein